MVHPELDDPVDADCDDPEIDTELPDADRLLSEPDPELRLPCEKLSDRLPLSDCESVDCPGDDSDCPDDPLGSDPLGSDSLGSDELGSDGSDGSDDSDGSDGSDGSDDSDGSDGCDEIDDSLHAVESSQTYGRHSPSTDSMRVKSLGDIVRSHCRFVTVTITPVAEIVRFG